MNACCPYLYFDGQAAEAMHAYQQALGGELKVLRYSDQPPGAGAAPPGCEPSDMNRVMHAMLMFEGGMLMCSDAPNKAMFEPAKGMSVNVSFTDAKRAQRVFEALSPDAQVRMPFGPTFWAEGFGMLVDRFGTPWMVGGGFKQP
ncbi:VOC family protein [Ramlibacter humi]|nr:VOC family protein [Ramlibacter humi]